MGRRKTRAAVRGNGRGSKGAMQKGHYRAEAARSQCARLLRYLREHGRIDTREARSRLNIMHPGGRVHDLRHKAGYQIRSVINPRTGVATYVLVGVDGS